MISSFAETNRLPFDLPEAEQELVGGYHTEYSAMKFGMFFLGEYLHVITVSYLTVILFFGGWDVPFLLDQGPTGWPWLVALAKMLVLLVKVALMIFFMMWVAGPCPGSAMTSSWTWPGNRLIPLALVNLVATATIVQLIRRLMHEEMGETRCVLMIPKLKRLTPPKLNLAEKFYLPQIAAGLGVTARHMAGVVFGNKAITIQYPEEQHVPSPVYRGVHRLNKDEQGRVKCVACMLCATACPAHCIDIVGATAPDTWPDREKYPESFVIDELRCIYCGMCEEACPVEAIELTGLYDLTGLSREQMIYDKTKLLSVFDATKDAEPMPRQAARCSSSHRQRGRLTLLMAEGPL